MRDLQELPKLRDSLSFLYIEHAVINQKLKAVEATTEYGRIMIPVANLTTLFLGPGTSITHAAVRNLAESGCLLVWVGEDGMRCYAQGGGETRKGYRLIHQSQLASHDALHMQVVGNMYQYRFDWSLGPGLTLNQVRGKEGARVRKAYKDASFEYGVEWDGRNYDRQKWDRADPINRALSGANALLNGLCHAAVVSAGYSPGLGFIHTGRQLSFVYDVADLYKTEVTIPIAFQTVAESKRKIEERVRQACRERFREIKLLDRILNDIDTILQVDEKLWATHVDPDVPNPPPARLWSPVENVEIVSWS